MGFITLGALKEPFRILTSNAPELGSNKRYAIEIKRSLIPTLSKGFHIGCEDVQATYKFIVYSGKERYPAANDVTVMPLVDMMNELNNS